MALKSSPFGGLVVVYQSYPFFPVCVVLRAMSAYVSLLGSVERSFLSLLALSNGVCPCGGGNTLILCIIYTSFSTLPAIWGIKRACVGLAILTV